MPAPVGRRAKGPAKRPRTIAKPAARRARRSTADLMDLLVRAAGEEFKRNGYAGATTAAIARRADVTEAQLFRYFRSKSELFREAIFKPLNQHFIDFNRKHITKVDQRVDDRQQAQRYIFELQGFIGQHSRMLMSLVVAQTYAPDSMDGLTEFGSLETYFKRGAAMMTRRLNAAAIVDPRLMVRVSFAAVLGCVLFKDWLFPRGLAGDADISQAIQDFVLDGINANAHLDDEPPRTRTGGRSQ
jgi:AcrR family transcriptional regulator